MKDEVRTSLTVKVKPSIQQKARHAAIDAGKRLGQWIEESIEEKAAREEAAEDTR